LTIDRMRKIERDIIKMKNEKDVSPH